MSEVNFKNIDNKLFRLEAEFYQSKYINLEKFIDNFNQLGSFSKRIECGPFGSNLLDTEYISEGILVVRPFNLKNGVVENNNLVYISNKLVLENNLKIYPVGTMLFSRVGDIKIGVLNKNNATISPNIIAVEFKDKDLSKFLTIFFLTKYGILQLERQLKIAAQPTISTNIVKELRIPILNNIYQNVINLFNSSQNNLKQSQEIYQQAETLLLENLGLKDFPAACNSVNVKSLKESFLQTGRLDAEYYQTKYEQYWNLIQSQDYVLIRDEYLHITQKPDWKNQAYQYIEIGDVNIGDGSYQANWMEYQDLPANAKIQAQKGDILVSTVRPYRGAVTIIGENDHDLVVSGAFTVLRRKENSVFNNEVLQVLLRSDLYKDWLLQFNVGTSYPVIKDSDILNLPIPKISSKTQIQIADYIRQSNALREEAQQLLAMAKNNVEAEIENKSFNINELEVLRGGVNSDKYLILLEKSRYFSRLAEWTLSEAMLFTPSDNVAVRSFSQSFGASGRLDAEYYQPKFDRLFAQLAKYYPMRLGDIVNLHKSVEPGSDAYQHQGIPFVRVADLSKFGLSQTDKYLNPNDFDDVIRPKKDTILLSKDGSVGIAYCVHQDLEVITSGAIVHLQIKADYQATILPEYLTLVLNSVAVQLQAERDAGGSIIQHWKPSEILDVIIPVLPQDLQKQIADKIQESFALKTESEALLKQAKQLVEREIECRMC
ncbi:restriction endonuclease subunit S [Neisseria yangbaofengii]|uniref:restriction endonuclease subunit S n=1 Tax=Neisseria yangbaofengii TaxID=2709396 RepID=UPI0019800AC6|nr:restriction endonuclease subunit S [Neisseria yangbaofengii]